MARIKNRGRGPKQKIRDAERQAQALELKKQGLNYDQIAAKVGYKFRAGAHAAVQAALKSIVAEPAEDVLKLELERLDRDENVAVQIIDANLARAKKAAPNSVKAVIGALGRRAQIRDQRAKYFGLYAPTKTELTGKDGTPLIDPSKLSDEQLLTLASGAYPALAGADGGGGARATATSPSREAAGLRPDALAAPATSDAVDADRERPGGLGDGSSEEPLERTAAARQDGAD